MDMHTTDMTTGQWLGEEAFHAAAAAKDDGFAQQSDAGLTLLVEKIGRSLARGLVEALRDVENHVAAETRRVGDALEKRLDSLHSSLRELTEVVSEQHSQSLGVQEQCRQLAEATASLQESGARQAGELEALRTETRESAQSIWGRIDGLSGEVGTSREETGALRAMMEALTSRTDALGERMDRQADALRSLYSTYSQRESELEQVVEGLMRLRSHPVAAFAAGL